MQCYVGRNATARRGPMRRFACCTAVLMCFLLTVCAPAQTKRPITEKDLFDFVWIGDTQLSPDARTLCFVETVVAPDHLGYQTSLYTLNLTSAGAQPRRLTTGPHDSSPRWSPDGLHLAFLRSVEQDGKPTPPQAYLTTLDPTANPIRLSDLPKGVSSPQWSPDGTWLAVTSLTPRDPEKAKHDAMVKARETGDAAHVSDVRIIDQPTYRMNGEGYLDPNLVPQVYLLSMPKADGSQEPAWQVTGGRFGVEDLLWHPAQGKQPSWIFFTSTREDAPYFDAVPHNTLYGVELPNSRSREIPAATFTHEFATLEAHGLSISPDGDHVAFHAEALPLPPAKPVSHQQSDLFVLDLSWSHGHPSVTGLPRNLTASKGFEMGSGVGGDNTAPRGGGRTSIAWSADGKQLLDVAGSQGSALLLTIDAETGEMKPISARRQAVLSFVASPDQKTVVALISNPLQIGDLFRVDLTGTPAGPHNGNAPASAGNQVQLTNVNEALFSQLDLDMPQEFRVVPTVNPNDIPYLTIDTFVQLPPHFDKTKKYPMILNIHGGPHSAYGWVFDHEMLWMAAKGYVVDYPNPRGSTTYGQKFANVIENNYPGDDFHDLMDTVDAVVAKGWADPGQLGVTGGSGGGLLTDWTVTQTDRFKAAVAQRDIVDAVAWWYTADIGEFHQYWWPGAPFASPANLELYKRLSPLTYVNRVKTPMMFILGDADYRTPPTAGGEEFFRALKYRCIPAVMVRFPRESHELSRSGEPWHRVERLENIVNWFDLWLLNEAEPQYDVTISPSCKVE
jgi:dipeptidyl aminopeptidase/acylaminoacyl peptidase